MSVGHINIPRGKCNKCGCDIAFPLTVIKDDIEIISGYMCHVCFDLAYAECEILRAEFDTLLADGKTYEEANQIMCDKLETWRLDVGLESGGPRGRA